MTRENTGEQGWLTPRKPVLEAPADYVREPAWRGIPPRLLIAQVQNTAPFLFEPTFLPLPDEPHLRFLRLAARTLVDRETELETSALSYFHLCLAAHHGSVATFVPTDVDVHIREKLWRSAAGPERRAAMAELVLESRGWSNERVSGRIARTEAGERTSGHDGEWLSTAVPAYASLRTSRPALAQEVLATIFAELQREAAIFRAIRATGCGRALLCVTAVLAHNGGDLDRVIDAWALPDDDPLRKHAYKAGHRSIVGLEEFFVAGHLYKEVMAAEGHRNFALRKPRCLRRSNDFLLPFSPFLYEWGKKLALHPALPATDLADVVAALVDGFPRVPGSIAYARALAGLEEHFPGGPTALEKELPARVARELRTGDLRRAISQPEPAFQAAWARAAWKRLPPDA